jgi:crossover junction endodeoxyribonuclease RusA
MILSLPFPPSVNTYWRSPNSGPLAGRHLISADGRLYRTAVIVSVLEQLRRLPVPWVDNVDVSLVLYPPDRRRRDIDNYLKALFDSLTHAGIWQDDSQIKRLLVEWGSVTKKGQVKITIGEFISQEDTNV